LTELGPSALTKHLSEISLRKTLFRCGFRNFRLHLVDHHLCHAVAAAFCSPFEECLVVTIDGIGDSLSGTISAFSKGKLFRKEIISGRHSLGIFFEHVTNLLNMRELEDEGKVMALANYAYPIPDLENPMLDFISVNGLEVKCKYSTLGMYKALKRVLWKYPSEQFAYMAQRTLEVKVIELIKNNVLKTGFERVALAGGLFSNIKVNRLIRSLHEVKECFVFPHMGDGGLALGAALTVNHDLNEVHSYPLDDLFLGLDYSKEQYEAVLKASGLEYNYYENIEKETAKLIGGGYIISWFQGRMEYGPRALGHRSILALPDSTKIKDTLNLKLKMRVWYQPFCPSMLEEDARLYLKDYDAPNPFMTMGYIVKEDKMNELKGVISVDGSCRPQIVRDNESPYGKLLTHIKKITGKGVLLNTSFNIHGEPMVCSPGNAVDSFNKSKNDFLVMGNYLAKAVS
ncbi:MAG: carbamoyltransferase C-terminal domain-containing protein, partial [Nitrospinota bacterium]